MIMDVGGVHVGGHDTLVALKMLRQLHAQLVRRCKVQRIIRRERLHDVVVAAALRFAELLFHRFEFRHCRPRYTVDAADELLHRLFPVGDVVDDSRSTAESANAALRGSRQGASAIVSSMLGANRPESRKRNATRTSSPQRNSSGG